MGPASVGLARSFLNRTGVRNRLYLDEIMVGALQTASLDSRITDSAAGATAYACGIRTLNERVSVFFDNRPCGTLMEAAKAAGKKTGVVVRSTLSHASPAAFTAHSNVRQNEQFIAGQQVEKGIDVMFGGGEDPYSFPYGGKKSPLDRAVELGYSVVKTKAEMEALTQTPALGLFAKEHMSYEIDAGPTEPTLVEMTQKALSLLSAADTENQGFMLFVEGSEIDFAGHKNDAGTQIRETVMYDETVKVCMDFANANKNTLIVSVSDHATGGLVLGKNYPGPTYPDPYWYDVTPFLNADMSLEMIATTIKQNNISPFKDFVYQHTGVNLTDTDVQTLTPFISDTDRFTRVLGNSPLPTFMRSVVKVSFWICQFWLFWLFFFCFFSLWCSKFATDWIFGFISTKGESP